MWWCPMARTVIRQTDVKQVVRRHSLALAVAPAVYLASFIILGSLAGKLAARWLSCLVGAG